MPGLSAFTLYRRWPSSDREASDWRVDSISIKTNSTRYSWTQDDKTLDDGDGMICKDMAPGALTTVILV